MRGTSTLLAGLLVATPCVECLARGGAGTLEAPGATPVHSRPIGLMPQAITSFGADALGGWLYVLGGYHGTPHEYSWEGQSREFYRINTRDTRDIELLPNEDRMQSVALVAAEEQLYRIGGMEVRNSEGEDADMWSTAEFASFDPVTETWTELEDLPDVRSSHQGVVVGDTLYVIGGWKLSGPSESGVFHETYLTRDLSDRGSGWVEHQAPFRRRALALAATSHHVVVVGGMQDEGSPCRNVDILDTQTGEWSAGPEFPGSGFAASATAIGDVVYASGREGEIYRLDVGTIPLAWASAGDLSFPRFFHELVTVSDTQVLALGGIGGMDRSGRIRHIEAIDLVDLPSSKERVTAWTLPSPGRAKNRQAAFIHERELYLFGGNKSLGQHDFDAEFFLSEGFKLNLVNFRWTRLADFPRRRQTIQTVVPSLSDFAYAVGGFGHDGEEAVTHTEAFTYDFEKDAWEEAGALPVSRSQFGLADHGGALWVFGGLDYDPRRERDDRFRHLTSVVRADLMIGGGFEQTETGLPGPRRAGRASLRSSWRSTASSTSPAAPRDSRRTRTSNPIAPSRSTIPRRTSGPS